MSMYLFKESNISYEKKSMCVYVWNKAKCTLADSLQDVHTPDKTL